MKPAASSSSSQARHTAVLLGGTTFAQLVPLLLSPLLTRLYTPEDFGVFGIFFAVSTFLYTAVTGRYDRAILLPADDREARNIVALSLATSLAIAIISFLVLLALSRYILIGWLTGLAIYAVPTCAFLNGGFDTLYAWSNRCRRYTAMASCRMIKSISLSLIGIVLGLIHAGPTGLIIAAICAPACASLGLLLLNGWPRGLTTVFRDPRTLISVAYRYSKFPLYSAPAGLLYSAVINAPTILLSSLAGAVPAGYYTLTVRVLAAPSAIAGQAFGDVYRERASKAFIARGTCTAEFTKTLLFLGPLTFPVYLALMCVAPWLFSIAFGPEWLDAGQYAQVLAPAAFLTLLSGSVASTMFIAEKQQYDLAWEVLLLLASVLGVSIGCYLGSPLLAIALYGLLHGLLLLVHLRLSYLFTKDRPAGPSPRALPAAD